MRAESDHRHLPWLEAGPSAFHSNYTAKSFGAAYRKCLTLSAEGDWACLQELRGGGSLPFTEALHQLPG